MIVLTKQLGIPPSFEEYQYGIGLWTDKQQNQSYLYCASIRQATRRSPSTDSSIFRLNINERSLSGWEFVGKLDFLCEDNTISPCGQYFWSMEMTSNTDREHQLIFRQIDPKTLKYEAFRISGLEVVGTIRSFHFYYTQYFGVILIVGQYGKRNGYFEVYDVIFRLNVNQSQKCIYAKEILLPNIPTVNPYDSSLYYESFFKKSSFGLIENGYSLFFYQIDYFGDVFVLEWSEFETLEWNQFTIEGDQFESWMGLENRDLSTHKTKENIKEWVYGVNSMANHNRVHLPNGFLYCTRWLMKENQNTYFYHCDFQIETRICRCKHIFSTIHEFGAYRHVISLKNMQDEPQLFFFSEYKEFEGRSCICWEQVVVNKIPPLLNLTYRTVCRVIGRSEEIMDELPSTILNEDKERPKKKSILGKIMQRFGRPKKVKNALISIPTFRVNRKERINCLKQHKFKSNTGCPTNFYTKKWSGSFCGVNNF